MATSIEEELRSLFPGLAATPFKITSPIDEEYNCVAWALQDSKNWWWPDEEGIEHWPAGLPREETLAAFAEMLGSFGYQSCDSRELENGAEKIAIYSLGALPSHMARQLDSGMWTSKLGPGVDIEHALEALEGTFYGRIVAILRRAKATRSDLK